MLAQLCRLRNVSGLDSERAWPLVIRGSGGPAGGSGGRAIPDVVCSDGPDQGACVERAGRHGLFVQYPDWAGPPPLAAVDPSAGPTIAPFPVSYRPGH